MKQLMEFFCELWPCINVNRFLRCHNMITCACIFLYYNKFNLGFANTFDTVYDFFTYEKRDI